MTAQIPVLLAPVNKSVPSPSVPHPSPARGGFRQVSDTTGPVRGKSPVILGRLVVLRQDERQEDPGVSVTFSSHWGRART
jgi:hypothetical protein